MKKNVENVKTAVWKDFETLHYADGIYTDYTWCKNGEQAFKHEKNLVVLLISRTTASDVSICTRIEEGRNMKTANRCPSKSQKLPKSSIEEVTNPQSLKLFKIKDHFLPSERI